MAIERAHCREDCTCASRQARPWRSSLSTDTGRSLQYIAARVLPHPFREKRKKTHVLSQRASELLTRYACQNRYGYGYRTDYGYSPSYYGYGLTYYGVSRDGGQQSCSAVTGVVFFSEPNIWRAAFSPNSQCGECG